MKKYIIIGSVVVIAAVLVVLSLVGSNGDETMVQADLAFVDDITEEVSASGRIQPQTKVDITAEVSTEIIDVFVDEGNRVNRGQSLLMLDTVQLKADVERARFSLDEITALTEAAKSQYRKDSLDYLRQLSLFKKDLTSETAFTSAEYAFEFSRANYHAMLAQVNTGKASLDKAQDLLERTHIIAPMDGVITYLNAEVGEIAQAQTSFTQGLTLMTVADLSVFEVEVDVDESEIAKIHLDQTAQIKVDAFRDTLFEGSVVEIGNSAMVSGQGSENYSTSFRVKVRFARSHPDIRPGMSATVEITTAKAEGQVLIPYASVVRREFDPDSLAANVEHSDSGGLVSEVHAAESNDSSEAASADNQAKKPKKEKVKLTGVFVIKDGTVEFVEIETGIADDRNIAALSGVTAQDTVVSGSFQTLRRLKDGEQVRISRMFGVSPRISTHRRRDLPYLRWSDAYPSAPTASQSAHASSTGSIRLRVSFLRFARSAYSAQDMINPNLVTVNVLGPIDAKVRSMLCWRPSTVETTAITDVTPMTIPSKVRNERSRLAQRAAADSLRSARVIITGSG